MGAANYSVALFCVICLAASSLHAQSTTRPHALVGKPIYTSDGAQIGKVMSIGTYKGKAQMIGEVGLSLGFGTRLVLIPNDIATVQADRILLTITSDQVSEMLRADK